MVNGYSPSNFSSRTGHIFDVIVIHLKTGLALKLVAGYSENLNRSPDLGYNSFTSVKWAGFDLEQN